MIFAWPDAINLDKINNHGAMFQGNSMAIVATNNNYDPYPLITKTPDTCGGEPRIIETRLSVRIIADLYWQGESVKNIADIYQLTTWEVEQVLDYAISHREEIEGLIHLNATA